MVLNWYFGEKLSLKQDDRRSARGLSFSFYSLYCHKAIETSLFRSDIAYWMLNGRNRSQMVLLDFLFGLISVAVDEVIFQWLVLLILNLERVAFIVDELDLEFAEAAILL